MFQKIQKMYREAKEYAGEISAKAAAFAFALLAGTPAKAQSTAGDYSAGTTALSTVADEIVKYVPIMVKLCYAIAGVVAIVGAISVYIAMNNEEQDVKKKIMLIVGACLFLIIIGKTKCDGIQNQMRLFGGRVSPKRKATKISHTHTKKHRSNGF